MSEHCNSRHFSWLMKSCLPNPSDAKSLVPIHQPSANLSTTIASLPDDLLLECISRVPSSSIPSLSVVCRRWSRLLHSPYFLHLRRRSGLLRHSLIAISAVDSGLFAADLQFLQSDVATWKVSLAVSSRSVDGSYGSLSHARAAAIGPRVYVVSRNAVLRYDSWMGTLVSRSPMLFPRKKFAIAVVSGKIYVAGGGSEVAAAVEEYDPEFNRWEVVTQSARKRYGCIGAAVDGVFYVIGGLKIGNETSRAVAARAYASSMDLFDVESRQWLRSRSVPGGGCVVAACAAVGYVYVLSSHAVELSFWRFDARRRGGNSGFGEWRRLKSPPLPAQVRLDGTVRFSCVGVEDKVAVVQVVGCIDDLLRRSGRSERGLRESLVLMYDTVDGEWRRAADLPEMITRAACTCVEW